MISMLFFCLLTVTTLSATPLRLGDGALTLTLRDDARLASVVVDGQELLSPEQTGGFSVYDVGEQKGPYQLKGKVERLRTRTQLTYLCEELGLHLTCDVQTAQRHSLSFDIRVEDLKKNDRGITLEFGLPVGVTGWTWWDDADSSRPVEAGKQYANLARLRELPGLPEFDDAANVADFGSYSWYPVATITAKKGIALCKPPRAAGLFRLGFDGKRGVFYCAFDFALSQDSRRPGQAEFAVVLCAVPAEHGFRGALSELYALWPEDFKSRVPDYGGWMPFYRLSRIANVDEFSFAYQEGASEPLIDDVLGVSSFIYFHCAGEFVNIPGYQRGQPLPPYEEQLAAVNASVKRSIGIENLWNITGIQLPDGRINIRPENTYGHLFAQPCVHPDLPYGKHMADVLTKRVSENTFPVGIDGCYYDGIAVGLDYSREHFNVTRHPLLWDARLRRPVAYNFFSSLEWAERIADTIHPLHKMTMLNDSSLSAFSFSFPYIDVLGAEGGWVNSDAECHRARAYCYHKPFCTLLKTDFRQHPQAKIETYMRQLIVFGHIPGFFDISPSGANPGSSYWEHPEWYDRDRELFRRYMPLCAELNRAGWEPVQYATTSASGAKIERFGGGRFPRSGELVYFTIRRAVDAEGDAAVTLQLSPEIRCASAKDAMAVDLLTGETQRVNGGKVTVAVPAGEIGIIAVGTRNAHVARCLDRVKRLIEARQRYVKSLTSTSGLGLWEGYMNSGEIDSNTAHSGRASLRVTLTDATKSAGAIQDVRLNQSEPEDLIVRAFSKAENVSGNKDSGYSIYVDCYYHNGGKLYGQTIQFDTGTHEWQGGELRIHPTSTILVLNVYCMFRGHTGKAWFDDIFLAQVSDPEKNLLKDGGFERAITPLEDPLATEAGEKLDKVLRDLFGTESANVGRIKQAGNSIASALRNFPAEGLSSDAERAKRDLRDVAGLLRLAAAIAEGASIPRLWPQRLTPAHPIQSPRKFTQQPSVTGTAVGRVPRGTKVTVDGNYEGYHPGPLTDGKINPKTDDWAAIAWASQEETTEHWVQLEFPSLQRISSVNIHWAFDNGAYFNSRKISLEAKQDNQWVELKMEEVADPSGAKTLFRFTPIQTSCLRIRQPVGGGPASRPHIMWVSEVEVF